MCTLQGGVSISYSIFGIVGAASGGLVFDSNGNFSLYYSGGLGGGLGAGLSGGVSFQYSNADTIYDIEGPFVTTSIGLGAGINGTFDQFAGYGTQNQYVYGTGFTLGAGLGASAGVTLGPTYLTGGVYNLFGGDTNDSGYDFGGFLNQTPGAPTLGVDTGFDS